jgi:putative DNA primase/helicase
MSDFTANAGETMREVEQILAEALEAERLHDKEICARVSMGKLLALFPEVEVVRVAHMRKLITPDSVWAYNPANGLFRNSEREELNKIEFYARLTGYSLEAARIELANPDFWREEGETDGLADEIAAEEEIGYSFADLDLLLPGVSWLWEPWLPRGMITLLAGEPGVGKSALALAIAAAVMQMAPWPDRVPREAKAGLVVWTETEAAHAITRERATNWGIPKEQLLIPTASDDPLAKIWLDTQEGWDAVEREIHRDGVALLVLDSLRGAYRGDENASTNIELLNKLAALTQRRQVPALVTHHLRKRGMLDNGKIDLDRVRGSSAIVQIPRVVWGLDRPDPLTPHRVRLQQLKNNLSRFPEPLGFEITDRGITFTDAPTEPEVETQREKAADLLLVLLKDGPMLASEIYEAAEATAVSKSTLQRAKRALGIVHLSKDGHWFWSLPHKERG